jgi:hypothetical protein
MEYWITGVLGENRIAAYQPCFRAYHDMIICPMKVIGQNQIQGDVCQSF